MDSACLALSRIAEAFARSPEHLEVRGQSGCVSGARLAPLLRACVWPVGAAPRPSVGAGTDPHPSCYPKAAPARTARAICCRSPAGMPVQCTSAMHRGNRPTRPAGAVRPGPHPVDCADGGRQRGRVHDLAAAGEAALWRHWAGRMHAQAAGAAAAALLARQRRSGSSPDNISEPAPAAGVHLLWAAQDPGHHGWRLPSGGGGAAAGG